MASDLVPEPSMTNSLFDLLTVRAERAPGAIAIRGIDRRPLTYEGLHRQAWEVLRSLNAFGIARRDRVAIALPNGPEMAVAFLTVSAAAASVPLNPASPAEEIELYFAGIEPKAMIVPAGDKSPARFVAEARGLPVLELSTSQEEAGIFTLPRRKSEPSSTARPGSRDDVSLILHTSGSTGKPKAVPLTQSQLLAMALANQKVLELQGADRCLNVMPLFHSTGLIGVILASIASGASVICAPGFYAPEF